MLSFRTSLRAGKYKYSGYTSRIKIKRVNARTNQFQKLEALSFYQHAFSSKKLDFPPTI